MRGFQKEGWGYPSAPPPPNRPYLDRWVLSLALIGAGMGRGGTGSELASIFYPEFVL